MNRIVCLATLATVTALTGCELQPGQPDHIVVTELEAPWVSAVVPTELWIEMITEGDFAGRCRDNFGGVFYIDSRGFICEVGLDQDNRA